MYVYCMCVCARTYVGILRILFISSILKYSYLEIYIIYTKFCFLLHRHHLICLLFFKIALEKMAIDRYIENACRNTRKICSTTLLRSSTTPRLTKEKGPTRAPCLLLISYLEQFLCINNFFPRFALFLTYFTFICINFLIACPSHYLLSLFPFLQQSGHEHIIIPFRLCLRCRQDPCL